MKTFLSELSDGGKRVAPSHHVNVCVCMCVPTHVYVCVGVCVQSRSWGLGREGIKEI